MGVGAASTCMSVMRYRKVCSAVLISSNNEEEQNHHKHTRNVKTSWVVGLGVYMWGVQVFTIVEWVGMSTEQMFTCWVSTEPKKEF